MSSIFALSKGVPEMRVRKVVKALTGSRLLFTSSVRTNCVGRMSKRSGLANSLENLKEPSSSIARASKPKKEKSLSNALEVAVAGVGVICGASYLAMSLTNFCRIFSIASHVD